MILHLVLILLALVTRQCRGQIGGLCACTPTIYEWTLDFGANCSDIIIEPQGVEEFNCKIEAFQPEVQDLTPVSAVIIDIVEFNQNLQAEQQTILDGEFNNSDTFSFVSITAIPDDVTAETVPKAIQITIVGLNVLGQPLSMVWIMRFSNSCDEFPVVATGNQIAWTQLTNITDPVVSLCPISGGITSSPTPGPPTLTPTLKPTIAPSRFNPSPVVPVPTRAPVPSPTQEPSEPTTLAPTVFCPPTPGKGKGKGKGFYVPKMDYERYEYDYAYTHKVKTNKSRRRKLKTSKSPSASKSKDSKSSKSSKSKGKGYSPSPKSKGKGLFPPHPTSFPSPIACVPTAQPVHRAPSHKSKHSKPTPSTAQWPRISPQNQGAPPGWPPYLPYYPGKIPIEQLSNGTETQNPQDQGEGDQNGSSDGGENGGKNGQETNNTGNNSGNNSKNNGKGSGGGASVTSAHDGGENPSGLSKAQIAMVVLLMLGLAVFAVITAAYYIRERRKYRDPNIEENEDENFYNQPIEELNIPQDTFYSDDQQELEDSVSMIEKLSRSRTPLTDPWSDGSNNGAADEHFEDETLSFNLSGTSSSSRGIAIFKSSDSQSIGEEISYMSPSVHSRNQSNSWQSESQSASSRRVPSLNRSMTGISQKSSGGNTLGNSSSGAGSSRLRSKGAFSEKATIHSSSVESSNGSKSTLFSGSEFSKPMCPPIPSDLTHE